MSVTPAFRARLLGVYAGKSALVALVLVLAQRLLDSPVNDLFTDWFLTWVVWLVTGFGWLNFRLLRHPSNPTTSLFRQWMVQATRIMWGLTVLFAIVLAIEWASS